MIRHKQFTTGTGRSGAGKYFTEHLSVSAYYANGVGLLQGQAFEHVSMEFREVDLEVFTALEANLNLKRAKSLRPGRTRPAKSGGSILRQGSAKYGRWTTVAAEWICR